MSNPKLPPLAPPPIPASRMPSSGKEPKKSNFFTILMLTFVIFWTLQLLMKRGEENKNAPDSAAVEESAPSETIPAPTAEESEKLLASLPAEAAQNAQKTIPPAFHTLGSADENSPFRMLVTLTNRGAAVTRVELNEKAYRDCFDKSGWLGQIVVDESLVKEEFAAGKKGVAAQVIGDGTPAQKAGLLPGDRIVSVERTAVNKGETAAPVEIDSFETLRAELLKTRPDETVKLGVLRAAAPDAAEPETVEVTLSRAPLSIIRPEGTILNYNDYKNLAGLQGQSFDRSNELYDTSNPKEEYRRPNTDPASFLLTLASYDDKDKLDWLPAIPKGDRTTAPVRTAIDRELPDLEYAGDALNTDENPLRGGNWELLTEESDATKAVFRKTLPQRRLELRKIYALEPVPLAEGQKKAKNAPEYHLTLTVEIRNLDAAPHAVSFALDGPTGLPIEGAWYSSGRKTGPKWGSYGLRDMVLGLNGGKAFYVVKCWDIATEEKSASDAVNVDFIGIDTQYFQCSLIPDRVSNAPWQAEYQPIRVGSRIAEHISFTNTSFRLKSPETTLAAAGTDGDKLSQSFKIFAGPKQQPVLNAYGLGETLVYGWFWFISKPLVWVLHLLRAVTFNYGLAIILLTVVVRLCMFPLSIKQVTSSLKMQKIQPEINALKERYKDNPQEMMRAQQALWKKHNIHPLGGCLPLFIQMPIFIGLYKVLSLDVNLYGAPLFSEHIRWCGNLAAPDMMIDWSRFWIGTGWTNFNLGQGMFTLGPYFNLLPMLTIVLFLVQQKFLMPPITGTDAEQAQQRSMRRIMNFMMIFMGFMFFKVPSGLCVYFVASSLWGILERKFHPKLNMAGGSGDVIDVEPAAPKQAAIPAARSNKKRTRRTGQTPESTKPGGLKGWWQDVLERAKEQQKLAKAEAEKRVRDNNRKRR